MIHPSFYMFWDVLWALVLGFVLSGAVQASVPRDAMQRRLGERGPKTIARASAYGMVSSSCSYAASAMARSLFVRGTDFVAAMVFMLASTNLVLELGIVLLVLIGWQFVVAEFAGGVIMVVLLAGAGGLWLRGRTLAEAEPEHPAGQREPSDDTDEPGQAPMRASLRSRASWVEAADYTMSDLRMLSRSRPTRYVSTTPPSLISSRWWPSPGSTDCTAAAKARHR